MDIIGGLAAANSAVSLVKELREIDQSVDEAAFKLKIAEITAALADAKIALSDARLKLNQQELEISGLRDEVDKQKNGDFCPKCRNGRMQLTSSEPYVMAGLGTLGVREWRYECDNVRCNFETTELKDPHGVIPRQMR